MLKNFLAIVSVIISIGFFSCGSTPQNVNNTATDNSNTGLDTSALVLQKTIQLPNVKGGFDLMAIDSRNHRLFLAAQDNHTVEVLDLKAGKSLTSIPGFNEPKWIVYLAKSNKLYISTGGDGKVTVMDATTYKKIKTFSFKEKCNNLRFDSTTQRLYVGVGDTFGAIGIIDVVNDKIVNEIPLSDFPKQFEIDGNLLYVNIPSKKCIDIVDLTENKVINSWAVTEAKQNVPMALDHVHQRLFVGCEPGKFIIYSTKTGKSIQSLNISKEADGIYYEAKRSRVYVSCGEGSIEVIEQKDADHYNLQQTITTAKGAGTSLFSPQLDKYILAVPQSLNQIAGIRIYQPAL